MNESNNNNMHDRIISASLKVFSEKGFYDATVKDIADTAGCNTVTIFRHFEDKENLFKEVVEKYKDFEFDADELDSKLSYINLRGDFRIMADFFFMSIYKNIPILRIYINEINNFDFIKNHAWFVPDDMKNFVSDYITSIYMDKIRPADKQMISEMFICYILRTCLRLNVHKGIEENNRQISKDARNDMSSSVEMVVDMLQLLTGRS